VASIGTQFHQLIVGRRGIRSGILDYQLNRRHPGRIRDGTQGLMDSRLIRQASVGQVTGQRQQGPDQVCARAVIGWKRRGAFFGGQRFWPERLDAESAGRNVERYAATHIERIPVFIPGHDPAIEWTEHVVQKIHGCAQRSEVETSEQCSGMTGVDLIRSITTSPVVEHPDREKPR